MLFFLMKIINSRSSELCQNVDMLLHPKQNLVLAGKFKTIKLPLICFVLLYNMDLVHLQVRDYIL